MNGTERGLPGGVTAPQGVPRGRGAQGTCVEDRGGGHCGAWEAGASPPARRWAGPLGREGLDAEAAGARRPFTAAVTGPAALSPQVQRRHRRVAGGRGSDQDGLSGEQVREPGQGWAAFSHSDVSSYSLSCTPTLFLTLGDSLKYGISNFY